MAGYEREIVMFPVFITLFAFTSYYSKVRLSCQCLFQPLWPIVMLSDGYVCVMRAHTCAYMFNEASLIVAFIIYLCHACTHVCIHVQRSNCKCGMYKFMHATYTCMNKCTVMRSLMLYKTWHTSYIKHDRYVIMWVVSTVPSSFSIAMPTTWRHALCWLLLSWLP